MKSPTLSLACVVLLPGLLSAAPGGSSATPPATAAGSRRAQQPAASVASAAGPQVRRAEVAVRPSAARAEAVGSLGERERGVLRRLQEMPPGQISELLEAYARMGNRRMTQALSQELLRRDPGNTRPRELAATLMRDAASPPDDPAVREAEDWLARRQPAQAARVFTGLKRSRYQSRVFPWQEDLAYAWHEAGQTDQAKAAFEEILKVPGYPESVRAEAGRALRMLLTDRLSREGYAALGRKEAAEAHRLADRLLAADPDDPDAVSLKAGAWTAGGKPRAAVDWLQGLRRRNAAAAPGARFRHRVALSDALLDARMFDDARRICEEILADPQAGTEEKGEARENLAAVERDSRLTAGDHALRTGRLEEAARLLAELERLAPGHADTAGFRAAVQLKRRQYGQARTTLEQLRARDAAQGAFFDERGMYAEVLAATGAPKAAAREYALVKDEPRHDPQTRYEAARQSALLAARFRPSVGQRLEAAHEAEGSRTSAETEISTGETGSPNVFLIRSAWDTVELDRSRLLRMREEDRWQAEAAWRRHMRQGFYGEVSAGGSSRGAVFGAAAGRYAQPGAAAWELGFRANDRAMDSLPLVAMDGRQNQVALTVQRDFGDRFSLDGTVRYRWVDVQGRELGEGVSVNLNATWTLLAGTPVRPELSLSWLSEIQRFARRNFGRDFGDRMLRTAFRGEFSGQDLAGNLIDERLNRHGLILTLSHKFSPRFGGYVYGGFAREFEYGETEGLAGAGVEAFVGPSATLFLNVDYSTSGRAGSRGTEVWSATSGARISF